MRDDRPIPQPSQIWVIEQVPTRALSAPDRAAVARANVVIYDRSLAGLVVDALAPGGYAEPLRLPCQAAGQALSARAVQFAADGWSVVQLVEASPCWRERLAETAGDGAVHMISHDDRRYIFGPAAPPPAPAPFPFTANGLAG